MHYTLTNDAGETLDSSTGKEPLLYLHGAGNIIPGLESQMAGRGVGDTFRAVVQPAEGYGESIPEMIQTVPREAFGDIQEITIGMQFEAGTDSGQSISVVVTEVTADTVTVDGNHPLAGQVLTFDIEVVDIREATSDEISHGHAHGPGGHHHH